MEPRITYSVAEARELLPTMRAALLQMAVEREVGGDGSTTQALLEHLESLGVVLRDIDHGLVDIPGERDGESIWLCWRLDDPDVAWWHTTREGYASRRAL